LIEERRCVMTGIEDIGEATIADLRRYLKGEGIPQVNDCTTDEQVIALAIKVMAAMTRAYRVVATMVDELTGMQQEQGTHVGKGKGKGKR
jgi:hypothetical protein